MTRNFLLWAAFVATMALFVFGVPRITPQTHAAAALSAAGTVTPYLAPTLIGPGYGRDQPQPKIDLRAHPCGGRGQKVCTMTPTLTASAATATAPPTTNTPTPWDGTQSPYTYTPVPPAVGEEATRAADEEALINVYRASVGLAPLDVNPLLHNSTRQLVHDTGPKGICQHDGTDGRSPWTRMTDAGWLFEPTGSIAGCGYPTSEEVVQAYWNSPGHHDIIVGQPANEFGCGWWINDFGYGWDSCDFGRNATKTPYPIVTPWTATPTPSMVPTQIP